MVEMDQMVLGGSIGSVSCTLGGGSNLLRMN